MTYDITGLPDFSRKGAAPEPKRFVIDGYVYECTAILPAGATRDLARLARLHGTDNVISMIEVLGDFMDAVMLPECAKEFAARIRDPEHPIDDNQIGEIVVWLIREYGGRPTSPPLSSSDGRIPTGSTSTDGASAGASTSPDFPSIVS